MATVWLCSPFYSNPWYWTSELAVSFFVFQSCTCSLTVILSYTLLKLLAIFTFYSCCFNWTRIYAASLRIILSVIFTKFHDKSPKMVNQINIYELISVCSCMRNVWVFSETAYNSQTKLIGLNLHVSEHGIGYSNFTPDPKGARGALGVKIQVSPNQKTSITKVVRDDKGMIKVSSAPPEELGKPAKRVS